MPQQSTLHSTCSARVLVGRQYNMSSHIYIYIHASIEARLWRASLLRRFGTMALQRRWLGDGASSNALSFSLFAPMVDPVAKQWPLFHLGDMMLKLLHTLLLPIQGFVRLRTLESRASITPVADWDNRGIQGYSECMQVCMYLLCVLCKHVYHLELLHSVVTLVL